MSNPRIRVGFDIGGTFTDLVLHDAETGRLLSHKLLTTADDPSAGALAGLRELTAQAGIGLGEVGELVHGTTLVTNALIERKGAPLAMLTTRGFRDVIELGTEQRYDIYDLFLDFPEPLVTRDLRLEIAERIDRDGRVVEALDEEAVHAMLHYCAASGVEAVAVCFINAYRNPAHEQRVADIAAASFPGLAISTSSAVVSAIREYPRFVTTCANASVQPLMRRYLERLQRELAIAGFVGDFRLMQSDGGLITADTAARFPIRLLESGPAGGGLASALVAQLAGRDEVLAFDMGGTTAKACRIGGGRIDVAAGMEVARINRFARGSGLPIEAPVIDMIEIGAGGGSIPRIDEVGLLKVGPDSAGSQPGPACYGRGGQEPTVTDANLVLGFYDPQFFLGGRMALDVGAARTALARLADPLGLTVEDVALGIYRTVNENMAAAARVHLIEKGRDPRGSTLVGYGGAGPAHAVEVARALGIAEVIVPPGSGAASALGFLTAPLAFEVVRSHLVEFDDDFDSREISDLLDDIEAEARDRLLAAGLDATTIAVERSLDMRLVGQMHTVGVPIGDLAIDAGTLPAILAAFNDVYARQYVTPYEGARVEAVNFRVRCIGPAPALDITTGRGAPGTVGLKGRRRLQLVGGPVEAEVYDRYALRPGDRIAGPAIIEERESTTVIGVGDVLSVDAQRNLIVRLAPSQAARAANVSDMPLADAMAALEADVVGFELLWSRLANVAEEMWSTVCRTALSLVISEAQDFACDLLDPRGDTLAHSARAMPVFNLTLPRAAKALIAAFPVETLKPGDVLVTNDPWLCCGHLFDIVVVTPVFRNGRVVALTATVGNVIDIGGSKDYLRAAEVYDEGFQIPPMKLFDGGHPDATFFRLFRQNVRLADQVVGDLNSLVAANELGARRLTELMAEAGLDDLEAVATAIQRRSERAMRDAIAAVPDGSYHAEIRSNPRGRHLRYDLEIIVAGDEITLDFTNVPPQITEGGFNCTLSYAEATATYPLKCMLTPRVRGNAGCFRPLHFRAPEGTILNARYPAPVNYRSRIGWYISPGLFSALAEVMPEAVRAATGLPLTSTLHGRHADGSRYGDILFTGGGQGAGRGHDGKSGLIWPSSAANSSVEMFESRVPMLIVEKAYLPDSGGAGEFRGGLGQRIRVRKLHDDLSLALASVVPEGVDNPIAGLFGGQPGGGAGAYLLDLEGEVIEDIGTGALVRLDRAEQVLEIVVAGGAGYGEPTHRAREAIEHDLRLGLVTPDGARRDYGYFPELRRTGT